MRRTPRRPTAHAPRFDRLETRELLAGGLIASWIGQDGRDDTGGPAPDAGNAIQDIHIGLSNLPPQPVSSVELLGDGGGRWVVNLGGYNPYNGKLIRSGTAASADLYVDPYQAETGRQFYIRVVYGDGSSSDAFFQGGTADPNLRTPQWRAQSSWVGQGSTDLVGLGAGVGPDGLVDAQFNLTRLYPPVAIQGVTVSRPVGIGWAAGTNPTGINNAEFVRDPNDATRGSLFLGADADLNGVPLTVTVLYADGRSDTSTFIAGVSDPNRALPAPAPVVVGWNTIGARWAGQDGLNLIGPGDVHLAITGVPAGRSVVSALLNNAHGTAWSYVAPGTGVVTADPYARPLGFRSGGAGAVDLTFAPVRNEAGSTLTLLLTLDDGSRLAARIDGGSADPGLRVQGPATSSVVAYPGDDLNELANQYGTVRLVAGVYPLNQPLVLSRPVNILGAPGTTLLFTQAAGAPEWTAAIKVQASKTTLDGFAVRFSGPVRWKGGISYGPAVVGTTDNFDNWSPDPLLGLAFTRLDLQSPPASTSWEEAPGLFRLVSAESGRVANNTLKGGTTEVKGGPWLITGNKYLGTQPNTFTYTAFAAHESREVTVADNNAQPSGPSGKTWRFLVMTHHGVGDAVLNNVVRGIGPMDTDTIEHPNSPETILTEAYKIQYEGLAARVSADGWVVQIPTLQSGQPRTGSVLAILSGPQAGQWRLIAQAISPTAYLLDAPIAGGARVALSIATGFVNQTFLGNTIDVRGSSVADPLVLAGNQFGTKVIGNRIFGGDQAFRITAYPSETPSVWGWTHAPFLGATISGNTVEDSLHGGTIGVESNAYAKINAGRVYFSGSFQDNTATWTDAFLARRGTLNLADGPRLATVGTTFSIDPGETLLTLSGNRVSGASTVTGAATIQVHQGTINGAPVRNQGLVLPALTTTVSPGSSGSSPGNSASSLHPTSNTPAPTVVSPVPTVVSPPVAPPTPVVVPAQPAPVPAQSIRPSPTVKVTPIARGTRTTRPVVTRILPRNPISRAPMTSRPAWAKILRWSR